MPLNSEPAQKLVLSVFIRGSKHLKTIKALRLRRRAFIRFSVFGTPDENLALVFDLLHKTLRLMLDILGTLRNHDDDGNGNVKKQ